MTVLRGVNLAWQLPGDYRLVREVAAGVDGAAYVEARNGKNVPVGVKSILGDKHWVGQNLSSGARSGSAVSLKKSGSVKRRQRSPEERRLVKVSGGNSKVQTRYLRTVALRDEQGPFTLFIVHIPTKPSGKQDEAIAAVAEAWRATSGRKVLWADCNTDPATFARLIGAPHHAGNGVVLWAWSDGWGDVRVSWRRLKGSDHAVGTFRA